MKNTTLIILLAFLVLLILGCSSNQDLPQADPVALDLRDKVLADDVGRFGGFITWGTYQLEIARDGSYASVTPQRNLSGEYGMHLNILKWLEDGPCTDCLQLDNIHLLNNGDLSVNISIRHPYDTPYLTGFDVRGIIMFPGSQMHPDNDLRVAGGYDPMTSWSVRFNSEAKGDAELMNPDGWMTIWAPEIDDDLWASLYPIEDGDYSILKYYQGKYASGENISWINAYIQYYSTETRHMFEAGETVTRTYIIRPPASGPIEACYAVYVHWQEPEKVPVVDPAADFGPYANAPMPYEFSVTQDEILDPDAPNQVRSEHLHFHIKCWNTNYELWGGALCDLAYTANCGGFFEPHQSGQPDDYYLPGIDSRVYIDIPDFLPGTCTYILRMEIRNPEIPWMPTELLGAEFHIFDVEMDASDGTW